MIDEIRQLEIKNSKNQFPVLIVLYSMFSLSSSEITISANNLLTDVEFKQDVTKLYKNRMANSPIKG